MQASGSGTQRPIPRRAHKKSKNGCRTCKIRKVKCDERPVLCVNCSRHYTNVIACDYDGQERVIDPNAQQPPTRRNVAEGSNQANGRAATSPAQVRRSSAVGREAEPLQLPQFLGAGRLDPFDARPATLQPGPSIDLLMGHYLSSFAYRSFPFYASKPLIELWWPFVRSDEVLFHVVLLLSGMDREQLQSRHYGIVTQQLLDRCLSLLLRRIKEGSAAGTSDATIVATATLAAMEHDRGNMKALDAHLEGLKRQVEMRGGLDAIRATNPMAANIVFWCAMISINEPQLLPITYGDLYRQMDWLNDPDTATLLTHDGGRTDLVEFGVDVVTSNMLHEVQRLSKLYTATLDYGTPQEAVKALSYLCSILERLMLLSKTPSDDSPIPGLSQSCRTAGCLHVLTPLSGYFPNPTLMLHTLVRDLKTSLIYMLRAIGTKSYLLLWLLAVGGLTAHSMPERSWFVGHIVVVITDLEIHTWEAMRQHLVKLAFHDNFCDKGFKSLWLEAREKQEALQLHGLSASLSDVNSAARQSCGP